MTDFYVMKKVVAENIRAHRLRLGITASALGVLVGHNGSGCVSIWENGKSLPSAYSLCLLADIFGCTVDELLGRS